MSTYILPLKHYVMNVCSLMLLLCDYDVTIEIALLFGAPIFTHHNAWIIKKALEIWFLIIILLTLLINCDGGYTKVN